MTITIQLTRGLVAVIDDEDADLTAYRWCSQVYSGLAYAKRGTRIQGVNVGFQMHRVILERVLGRALVAGELCDHIDGNGLNNCRSNLRVATRLENQRNHRTSPKLKSGCPGVRQYGAYGKWRAFITVNYKQVHLGVFDNLQDAISARYKAEREVFGEFAPSLSRMDVSRD